jgi:hypothetical protein
MLERSGNTGFGDKRANFNFPLSARARGPIRFSSGSLGSMRFFVRMLTLFMVCVDRDKSARTCVKPEIAICPL